MFAATCIGIAAIAVVLEAFRRLAKDYDAYALKQLSAAREARALSNAAPTTRPIRATALQQLIRAILHMIVFGIAYILMLLAMYFNGYIIISIIVGTGIGKFFCDWMTLGEGRVVLDTKEDECPTACCG
jgi:copper transporter 1